jgi:ElaB/YqjD/DUF883 family membrane-anchored ribosome-binding protein
MENQEKQSTLEKVKAELEELEVQLKLGTMEAKEKFQAKKAAFKTLVHETEDHLSNIEKVGEKQVAAVKKEAESLIDLLDADFDFSYTEYEDHPQKIRTSLHHFQEKVQKALEDVDDEAEKLKAEIDSKVKMGIEKFDKELELQQSYFLQQKEKAGNEFDKWKEKLLGEIQELKGKIDGQIDEAETRIDLFSDELSKAYDHLKKAFLNLKG